MDIKQLKETAKEHGVKIGMMNGGEFKQLAPELADDATIEYVGNGMQGQAGLAVVLTPDHLYLSARKPASFGGDVASIKREKINGVTVKTGVVFGGLKIDVQGTEYTIEKLPRESAAKLRALLG